MTQKHKENRNISAIKSLKDDWSDVFPVEIIHFGLFKVRGNWFQALVAEFQVLVLLDIITKTELVTEINEFLDYCLSDTFMNQELTKESDIDYGNRILDLVLEELSSNN